jgi:ABC-type uncharacterized transport system involved in gliding motility auxiliary subunit
MSTKSQQRLSASSLVLLVLAFIAAAIIANQLFKGWRIDLTENRLYTLSDGTKRILSNIDEPINLYFYFSDQATEDLPSLRDYANRVREMLEEFADASRGRLRLSVIDPLPFSEDEDRAAQFGLQGVQLGTAPDPVYMGLAGTNSVDDQEIIPFIQPDKEAFLEYDVAKLVSTLAITERFVIGLVSGVPMASQFDPQSQRMQPAWVVYQQAQQLFDIRDLGTDFDAVDDDVNVLWIVQPKNLSNVTQYAIDQFVMRGGKALIFVDPMAAVDAVQTEGMPQGMPPMGQSSDLPALFESWGIGYTSEQVVADAELALSINTGLTRRPTRHFGYLGVDAGRMSSDDIITADLNVINLAMAGRVTVSEESGLSLEPLLTSSGSASMLAASRFSFLPDPSVLQDGFVADRITYVVAGRVSGTLQSAFPNGPPETTVSSDAEPESADGAPEGHLSESVVPANIIVVADVDMLSDPTWVQTQSFFGQQIANAFASNGAFVINALENLSGSTDLIGVRSRASVTRPFTRVLQLQGEAEARFRETEQRLQNQLAETERRLGELQTSREDTGTVLLTEEQRAEIDRFINLRTEIRRDLRAVQRGLDQDIERLGTALKVINIGLVPLLLTVFVLFAVWRGKRGERS